jgi:hypothetical protein
VLAIVDAFSKNLEAAVDREKEESNPTSDAAKRSVEVRLPGVLFLFTCLPSG